MCVNESRSLYDSLTLFSAREGAQERGVVRERACKFVCVYARMLIAVTKAAVSGSVAVAVTFTPGQLMKATKWQIIIIIIM